MAAHQQPLFGRMNLEEAWRITKGDAKVVVAVIDNGIDFFHPDLKRQLTSTSGRCKCTRNGSGYIITTLRR
jgi:serine protease